MVRQLELGDITVDVVLKDIQNIHLSVYPPTGRVRIAAPKRMDLDTIRVFAISKLGWIKRQQTKFRGQEREPPREYLDRESHYLWGKRYLLSVSEVDSAPAIELRGSRILLQVRPGTDVRKRHVLVEDWYRRQIRQAVPALESRWQPLLGVEVERLFVRRMKTKWGSCNHKARTVRLNTELAKKASECLEYVFVHELVHLLEPTHNARFKEYMDQFMPGWRLKRAELNRAPLVEDHWRY